MKHLFLIFFLSFISAVFSQDENLEERITHFHADIILRNDCMLDVTETIDVIALNQEIKHGIFRVIPTDYLIKGNVYPTDLEIVSITFDGKPCPFQKTKVNYTYNIQIGNKNDWVNPGNHRYKIRYRVNHVLQEYEQLDELVWNVNGNDWELNIDRISTIVHLPKGIDVLQNSAYFGKYGSTNQIETNIIKDRFGRLHVLASTNEIYNRNEGITIAVGLKKGTLNYPSFFQNLLFWLRLNAILIICILALLFVLGYNFRNWWKYGKDPKPGTIVPQYHAPEGLCSAEIAYLDTYGKDDVNFFTAHLVAIASKGWMNIELIKKEKSSTYVFTPTEKEGKPLHLLEERSFHFLFRKTDRLVLTENKFNGTLYAVKNQLYHDIEKLHGEKYHVMNNSLHFKQYYPILITSILVLIAKAFYGGNLYYWGIYLVVAILSNVLFSYIYDRPTKEGRAILDHIAGLKMYILYADSKRLQLEKQPEMNFQHFEENLPYAIALGMAPLWVLRFDETALTANTISDNYWLRGSYHRFNFSSISAMGSIISSSSTPPTSSSSSGGYSGGGFSGWGGFSGGGFGGGGGGGW